MLKDIICLKVSIPE